MRKIINKQTDIVIPLSKFFETDTLIHQKDIIKNNVEDVKLINKVFVEDNSDEFEVIEVKLKSLNTTIESLMKAINRAIPYKIIVIFKYKNCYKVVSATVRENKRKNELNTIDELYFSEWKDDNHMYEELIIKINQYLGKSKSIEWLYNFLIKKIINEKKNELDEGVRFYSYQIPLALAVSAINNAIRNKRKVDELDDYYNEIFSIIKKDYIVEKKGNKYYIEYEQLLKYFKKIKKEGISLPNNFYKYSLFEHELIKINLEIRA